MYFWCLSYSFSKKIERANAASIYLALEAQGRKAGQCAMRTKVYAGTCCRCVGGGSVGCLALRGCVGPRYFPVHASALSMKRLREVYFTPINLA